MLRATLWTLRATLWAHLEPVAKGGGVPPPVEHRLKLELLRQRYRGAHVRQRGDIRAALRHAQQVPAGGVGIGGVERSQRQQPIRVARALRRQAARKPLR
eukprot:54083-Prorocentrum_minimum.AAC.1